MRSGSNHKPACRKAKLALSFSRLGLGGRFDRTAKQPNDRDRLGSAMRPEPIHRT